MTDAVVARLTNVSHHYGATIALDDVTTEIPARKMVGVIGPDGVGKSTLLALISGVRIIQSGEVVVFDGNLANAAHLKTLRARVAYMPQGLGRNLYPTLSVFENIDFFGRLFGQSASERRGRITELLTATALDPFEARPAGKLSGGMKQKLSLCCALINDPDLLILDEPTTGVDPLSRGQFWDLINTIRARRPQMSVVVATAYMDEAQRFDWLMAMDDGKIIADGTLKELLERTGEPTLDDAFIALMPEEKRALHQKVIVRPRVASADEVPAIEAEGLTRRFGDFVAVDHVNFKIAPGEIFGFLGSNGCGKSTTMKMLTGFLPATEGWAKLFGSPMGSNDMEMRRNVGYMTQAFSLYGELTVRQNLDLHAQLYHLPPDKVEGRIQELLKRYDLASVANAKPESLPLGIKQRLQLAVAVLHEPAILILDEPTSGVDPIARDAFWRTLIDLSRDDSVTIFLSTHFMNEAERCDRISLMHAGKVLAVGAPLELVKERGSNSLEDTFVGYLADAAGIDRSKKVEAPVPAAVPAEAEAARIPKRFDLGRLWAYARRETVELLRDPIRLAFAMFGPIILMLAFGYGISFDIENLQMAAFDQDNTPESRQLLEGFFRLPVFLGAAAYHLSSRGGAASEKWQHPNRRRSSQRVWPRFAERLAARGRCVGRRRHDVPRGNLEKLCHRRRQEAGRGPPEAVAARRKPECLERRRYPDSLSLQPGLSQRQRHGAERIHADALSDPRHHVGDCGGAGEGNRLHCQFPLHSDYQARVPARQAAPIRRGRHGEFCFPVLDGDFLYSPCRSRVRFLRC